MKKPRDGALAAYDPGSDYCELLSADPAAAEDLALIRERIGAYTLETLRRRAEYSERELYNLGITFTLYSENATIDRILPFDVIPRILTPGDWDHLERGIVQRITAINRFLHDVYHDQKILADGIVPRDLVLGNNQFRESMMGLEVRHDTYVHICGIDIVRDESGNFLVLEDNGRTPSGVSYVVENRHMMMRAFPDLAEGVAIRPVDDYGAQVHNAMAEIAPAHIVEPQIVLLSPGVFNSAYFEHVFLAREMGVPLVEGRDLIVEDETVYMKTTSARRRVDVIYRRLNDDYLDPEAFEPQSMLGVPGLMRAYRAGNVSLANAVGTGVADDKAVYSYMPEIIKYYLDEDQILANVPTYRCREAGGLAYTLEHMAELVVKPVGESGGYGVVVGPLSSKAELEECRRHVEADPKNYIAQPTIHLSVCPTLCAQGVEPRHVDLRPFAVTGSSTWVLKGGLSRVALPKGSLIVNSSQGGGSKDTWVLE